jgi:hypothetical protein
MTSKDDIKGLVSLKFLRPWSRETRLLSAYCLNLGTRPAVQHALSTKSEGAAVIDICMSWALKMLKIFVEVGLFLLDVCGRQYIKICLVFF